jgi:cation transport regulator ChaB
MGQQQHKSAGEQSLADVGVRHARQMVGRHAANFFSPPAPRHNQSLMDVGVRHARQIVGRHALEALSPHRSSQRSPQRSPQRSQPQPQPKGEFAQTKKIMVEGAIALRSLAAKRHASAVEHYNDAVSRRDAFASRWTDATGVASEAAKHMENQLSSLADSDREHEVHAKQALAAADELLQSSQHLTPADLAED